MGAGGGEGGRGARSRRRILETSMPFFSIAMDAYYYRTLRLSISPRQERQTQKEGKTGGK